MDVLLVDPSLFTAPYDAALSKGLVANGLNPRWAVRQLRKGEEPKIDPEQTLAFFYPWTDGPNRRTGAAARAVKGVEHAVGIRQLVSEAAGYDLVHFQWTPVPKIDVRAMRAIRVGCPVVLTVHDTTPYNGKAVPRLQRDGLDAVFAATDRIIVHTAGARDALMHANIDETKIAVVPHGLLGGRHEVPNTTRREGPWRIVLFGKLQHYKGIDILVEALGRLDATARSQLSVIVAGEPIMDLEPIVRRAAALGLTDTIIFRCRRQSDAEVAVLIEDADTFVFPYYAIQASGVLFLVATTGKWLIASAIGAFTDLIGHDGQAGALVPAGDVSALADALLESVGRRPVRSVAAAVPDWAEIGRMTSMVYADALACWSGSPVRNAA